MRILPRASWPALDILRPDAIWFSKVTGWLGLCGLAWLGLAYLWPAQAQVVPSPGPPQGIACAYNSTPPTVASGNAIWVQCDTNGKLITSGGGGGAAVTPLTPYISPSLEACHVMKASAATGISFGVTTGATAGYLMVFNSTTAPADGAVTPAVLSIQVPANASITRAYTIFPLLLTTGFTVCFSSTGPFTKTASATAMLEGTWQ